MMNVRSIVRGMSAIIAVVVALLAARSLPAPAQSYEYTLVKNLAHVEGVTSNQLVGYGVVVGLAGTGDSTAVIFTSQTIRNVLQTFGISVTNNDVRTRDVAAVMVTASLPPFAHSGDHIDVTVSAMGDASSLQGGTLLLTELRGADDLVYATAQGPVSVGGFVAGFGGNTQQQNFTAAGRVPDGGIVARTMHTPILDSQDGFDYVLNAPDFKTAADLAGTLNARFGYGTAYPVDAQTVHVRLPGAYRNDPVQFLADASDLPVRTDHLARVVMNERTGTIVFGGDIKLAPCAIAHGNLSITITTTNKVVQQPFTTASPGLQTNTRVTAQQTGGKRLVFVAGAATLNSVVRALNAMGVSPRDLIAIVQALQQAGSLQAEVVMQ
jgi:flagellar P-ring protein precursor FlgI